MPEILSKAAGFPALLRCVLVHDEMNDMNTPVDNSGCITGIVNWGFKHSSLPSWRLIIHHGCCDPRFADPGRMFCPEESKFLRNLYLQVR